MEKENNIIYKPKDKILKIFKFLFKFPIIAYFLICFFTIFIFQFKHLDILLIFAITIELIATTFKYVFPILGMAYCIITPFYLFYISRERINKLIVLLIITISILMIIFVNCFIYLLIELLEGPVFVNLIIIIFFTIIALILILIIHKKNGIEIET